MKKKWLVFIFLIFILSGCNENMTTNTVNTTVEITEEASTVETTTELPIEETTTDALTEESTEVINKGIFILEYPDETVEIEGEIGSMVVIPELIKDDFVFIGWSDGENYYAGLTEIMPGTTILTPEYVSVESVFEKVEVSLGQVSLINYYGDYDIVGLPMHWNGYLVVGFSTLSQTIDSFYGPSSLEYVNLVSINLTNVVAYGEKSHGKYMQSMAETELLEKIEGCTYKDGGEIDLDQLMPGQLNGGCDIQAILERNDEDALTVPGLGTFYTYDVLIKGNLWVPNHYYRAKYISIDAFSSAQQVFLMFSRNYHTLEAYDIPSSDLITVNNNQVIGDVNGEDVIYYIYSEEDVLYLNGEEQSVDADALFIGGNLKAIEVENVEGLLSIDGVLYKELNIEGEGLEDETYLQLLIYPKGKEETHLIMPENLVGVFTNNYIESIDTITINDHVVIRRENQMQLTISHLIGNFPNLKNIHVPEGHPYLLEEDGVIYDKDKELILFVNESARNLVVQDSVSSLSLYIEDIHFDSIHLSQGVEADFFENSIDDFTTDSISVDPNNPYIKMEDGIIYDTDETKILYIDPSLESLVLKSSIESINLSINLTNNIKDISLNELVSTLPHMDRFLSLESISLHENNPNYQMIDGCLYKDGVSGLYLKWIPVASDMTTIYIPKKVGDNGLSVLNSFYQSLPLTITWYDVDEDNAFYQAINGIIYDKDGERIEHIPPNYSNIQYDMPETVIDLENYFSMPVSDFIGMLTSIYINENYAFYYEENEIYEYEADVLTKFLHLVDTVTINPDSPYYDETYHIIRSLDQETLLAFTGNHETYEVPDYINDFNVNLLNDSTQLNHLIFNSSLSEIPEGVFDVDSLESITIKGTQMLYVEGFVDEILNDIGDTFHYYCGSSDIIIYVDASMVATYQNHPFWSIYEIKAIEE